MLAQSGQTLCFAAKWHKEPEVFWHALPHGDMLERAWEYLDQADAVITWYGTAFDIPTLNGEFFREGMPPPSPFKNIDMKKISSKKFRFPSNKLQYVSDNVLKQGGKEETGGFSTWLGCMNNDPKAWAKMEEYNRRDVVVMEPIYGRLLPWIDNHPNRNLYQDAQGCPNCGSFTLVKEGFSYTLQGKFQRYSCKNCGRWSRGTKRIAAVEYVGEK